MREPSQSDPPFWIGNPDKDRTPIEPELLEAARRNWERVLAYAHKQHQDTSRAVEIFESVVHSLSKVIRRYSGLSRIKSLDYYLFWAFTRRLNRLLAAEPKITYVGSVKDLEGLAGARDEDWVSSLEDELVLKEALSCMNKRTRHMFFQRQCGYSWDEIASKLGISTNNARVQFSCDVRKIRERILRRQRMKAPFSEGGSR